jgi:prepilin-type N-terminal cleavage/methylation domain-containing protein/prepilin-type processing-associated H-X9-DG protein
MLRQNGGDWMLHGRPGGRRGFTLVELLVVIAIIAILAAILLVVLPKATGLAQRAGCISNAKQLVAAVSMYAHDHDRRFVPAITRGAPAPQRGYTWCVTLQPYIDNEQILVCPSDPEPQATPSYVCLPHSYGLNYRYTYNTGFGGTAGQLTSKLTNVDEHSRAILLFELKPGTPDPGTRYSLQRLSRIEPRHGERAVFGFIDGHAEALLPAETAEMWE